MGGRGDDLAVAHGGVNSILVGEGVALSWLLDGGGDLELKASIQDQNGDPCIHGAQFRVLEQSPWK